MLMGMMMMTREIKSLNLFSLDLELGFFETHEHTNMGQLPVKQGTHTNSYFVCVWQKL